MNNKLTYILSTTLLMGGLLALSLKDSKVETTSNNEAEVSVKKAHVETMNFNVVKAENVKIKKSFPERKVTRRNISKGIRKTQDSPDLIDENVDREVISKAEDIIKEIERSRADLPELHTNLYEDDIENDNDREDVDKEYYNSLQEEHISLLSLSEDNGGLVSEKELVAIIDRDLEAMEEQVGTEKFELIMQENARLVSDDGVSEEIK